MRTFFDNQEINNTSKSCEGQVVVDLNEPSLDQGQLVTKESLEKAKQLTKGFLEQAKCTARGGAVLVNQVILAWTLLGHKFSLEDHKHLEYLLLSYAGVRGGAATLLELTGLKNKAANAITAYTLTEKNIIKMLTLTGFLRRMPINSSFNAALQVACSLMVFMDQCLSAKSLVEESKDPCEGHYEVIKTYYEGHKALTALATTKEAVFRAIQLGATTYTSGYALADVFVDAVSPVDPANQEQILLSVALVMALFGALSVAHPITSEINHQIKAAQINSGLVFLPLVSLMYDFLPAWFASNSLETGLIALALVVLIPAVLELMVSYWDYQEAAHVAQSANEMQVTVEEVIDEESHLQINS